MTAPNLDHKSFAVVFASSLSPTQKTVGGGGMRVVKEQGRIPDSAKVDRFPRYYIKEKLCCGIE
jgi:hypothetical protein